MAVFVSCIFCFVLVNKFLPGIFLAFLTLFIVLKKRRFGIAAPVDEEAKKKSRVERFESNKKVDSAEEEKRKARALRCGSF